MYLVGLFDENDLDNGTDKIAVEKAKKETGLRFTDIKFVKKKGKQYMQIFLCTLAEWEKTKLW